VSWDWIGQLATNASVDRLFLANENDQAATDVMVQYIRSDNPPQLMFIHLDAVDDAGHATYWGSPTYYDATKAVDGMISTLLGALSDQLLLSDTLVIVTADHGGYRGGHGQNNQANFYVPIILFGSGVASATSLSGEGGYVTNKDIAPTALYALGLKAGEHMQGVVLTEAFEHKDV